MKNKCNKNYSTKSGYNKPRDKKPRILLTQLRQLGV